MARPARIPLAGGRLRGGAYRPWRRGRALCADQALEILGLKNGRAIPTRGISVTIKPKRVIDARRATRANPDLQDEPAEIAIPGEVADMLLHIVGVDLNGLAVAIRRGKGD